MNATTGQASAPLTQAGEPIGVGDFVRSAHGLGVVYFAGAEGGREVVKMMGIGGVNLPDVGADEITEVVHGLHPRAGEHVVIVATPGYGPEQWTMLDSFELMIKSRHQGRGYHPFGLYVTGTAGRSRREYQGPILPGPHAATVGYSTCIAHYPLPQPVRVQVEHGDVLTLVTPTETLRFRVTDERGRFGQNPELVPVEA